MNRAAAHREQAIDRTTTTHGATAASGRGSLPRASLQDTLSAVAGVIIPTLAKGVIIRRPPMVALAERFDLDTRAVRRMPLIPFSGGPGQCPGQNLVLLLSSSMLAKLMDGRQFSLKPPTRLDARRPLPGTLNNYSLRFEIGS